MYLIELDFNHLSDKNYNLALTILEGYEYRKLGNDFFVLLPDWENMKYDFLGKKRFKKVCVGLVKVISRNGKTDLEIIYQLSELLTPQFDEMERFIHEKSN